MLDVQIARRRQNWCLASLVLSDGAERPIAVRCECGDSHCDEVVHMRADEFREVVYCHRGFVRSEAHRPRPRRDRLVRRRRAPDTASARAARRAPARAGRG